MVRRLGPLIIAGKPDGHLVRLCFGSRDGVNGRGAFLPAQGAPQRACIRAAAGRAGYEGT